MLYSQKGNVPKGYYKLKIGKSRLLSRGKQITLVGVSFTVLDCIKARLLLLEKNISVEIIDLISIEPLDIKTILKSVKKTKRVIIVENDWINCGISAEIISRLLEQCNVEFTAKRLGFQKVPCPTTKVLENFFYPSAQEIAKMAYQMVTKKKDWRPKKIELREIKEFKGPF